MGIQNWKLEDGGRQWKWGSWDGWTLKQPIWMKFKVKTKRYFFLFSIRNISLY